MPQVNLPKGVHRVRRKLANGKSRYHFYAWRGGPKFWEDEHRMPANQAFYIAFAEAAARLQPTDYMTSRMVDDFLSSTAIPKSERSRADIRIWALRFADHFKEAPAAIFEDRRSRGDMNEWRALWRHSPKQHDMAGVHAVRILNWAVQEGKLIARKSSGPRLTAKLSTLLRRNGRVAFSALLAKRAFGRLI